MERLRVRKCVVVTVTYNNATTIERFLQGLAIDAAFISRLILIDNGSNDDTVRRAELVGEQLELGVDIVRSSNQGFAGGYATGSQKIQDPAVPVLCLNPDVVLAPGTLRRVLEAESTWLDIGIVTVPLNREDGTEDPSCRRTLPRVGPSVAYAAIGRALPRAFRYNAPSRADATPAGRLSDGTPIRNLEATTGAFMLVSPRFRKPTEPVFDTDYWMYGEDLQLCHDAQASGFRVIMVECEPSLHVKGVSSGWPRSRKSNNAFHRAMYTYYDKNLRTSRAEALFIRAGVEGRRIATNALGAATRRTTRWVEGTKR